MCTTMVRAVLGGGSLSSRVCTGKSYEVGDRRCALTAWQHINIRQNTDKDAFARVGLRYDSCSNNITRAKPVLYLRSKMPDRAKPYTSISPCSCNGSTNSNFCAGGFRPMLLLVVLIRSTVTAGTMREQKRRGCRPSPFLGIYFLNPHASA